MKFIATVLLLVLTNVIASTAQDTVYLNKDRKPISKNKAVVYLTITTKTDTGYVVVQLKKPNQLQSKITYKDLQLKIKEGYSIYYDGTNVDSEGSYVANNKTGVWKYYHEDGKIAGIVTHENSKTIEEKYFNSNGEPELDLEKANHLPTYPGGQAKMAEYLKRIIKYPSQSKKDESGGFGGRVLISFVISKTGELNDAKVVNGINAEFDREALRAVNSMPNWNPGIQFNRRIRASYILPIAFAPQPLWRP